jgi:hypothetical protein
MNLDRLNLAGISSVEKEVCCLEDESVLIIVDPNDKIFNNNELESMRNVFLIDKDGNIIWRIHSSDDNDVWMGPFIGINYHKENGRITAYRWGGFLCEVDVKTGRVTKTDFVK